VAPQLAEGLDLAEADPQADPVKAQVTGELGTSDTKADEEPPVQDAFAGSEKDVPELQPEQPSTPKKKGPNIFVALYQDLQVITLPSPGEVAQTFAIVILLVAAYTGFVAVVDYGSQQVLGQVFSEFYQAARPEAPAM